MNPSRPSAGTKRNRLPSTDAKYHNTMTYNSVAQLSGNLFQLLRVSNADEHGPLLRTQRWFPHTSTPHTQNMRTRAVQGRRRYARTCRRSGIPTTSHALATFSGGGSWAEPLLQTAHRRIGFPNAMHRVWGPFPTEGVSFEAPPS